MNQRSCIACRKKQVSTKMIPLGIDQGGSFFVGKQDQRKCRWLCGTPKCIQRILNEPRKIPRPKNIPAPDSDTVRKSLKKYLHGLSKNLLCEARKSGLIIAGSHRVKNCDKQKLAAIIFSSDCSPTTRTQISEFHNGLSSFIFTHTSHEIGLLIGRGPRSVLALHPSRRTQSLIDTLRGWHSLG